MKEGGLQNVIFEVDLSDNFYDFSKFSMDDMCELVKKWITWTHDELHEESKVFVNFRDIPDVMAINAERIFQLVDFLATLPERIRPVGIIYEEPKGTSLPEECGVWAKYIRRIMDVNNWNGHLLVHIHEKFGYSDTAVLEVLNCN